MAEKIGEFSMEHVVTSYSRNSNGDIVSTTDWRGSGSSTTLGGGQVFGSFISTVIGTRMPGPGCIYLSQSLNFMSPARAGEKVTAMAQVMELHPKKYRATFKTVCKVNTRILLDGTALIQVPSRKLHADK